MEDLKLWIRGTQTMPGRGQQTEYMGLEKVFPELVCKPPK